jgi:hypothetical protein
MTVGCVIRISPLRNKVMLAFASMTVTLLIPGEAAHHNEMMSPAVTE